MTDLIVTNAKVATVDASNSIAEAVAVTGEKITAVGRSGEIAALAGPNTRIIDAGGRAVIPGLMDGHAHMDREGLKGVFPSLEGCRSIGDVLDRIRALAAKAAPGEWIVTMPLGDPPYYWNVPGCLAENRFPTRQELDQAAPDNPVYIRPIWGSGGIFCRWNRSPIQRHWTLPGYQRIPRPPPRPWNSKRTRPAS